MIYHYIHVLVECMHSYRHVVLLVLSDVSLVMDRY